MLNVLCLSSAVKGQRLIRTLKAHGCRVFLLTEERWRGEEWPYDALDGVHYMHSLAIRQHVIHAASYMMRGVAFDLIVPLDEYEVETAGLLREHFQLPGMTASQARRFSDKLAMRVHAQAAGIPVPEFTPVFNYDRLRDWMARVPPPWLLKPRQEAGTMGIQRCNNAEQVWRLLDQLGDQQSYRLLEQFVPSDVFHVDAVVWRGEVCLQVVSAYREPPLSIYHGGGVFVSTTVTSEAERAALAALNRKVVRALGGEQFSGVVHAEYLRAKASGEWLFLEAGARVGGAHIAEMLEYATGINWWEAWARVIVAEAQGLPLALEPTRNQHAAVLMCLARQEFPDLSTFCAPEVVWRLRKPFHAGLIVASPSAERITELVTEYSTRFAREFLARAEPWDTGRNI